MGGLVGRGCGEGATDDRPGSTISGVYPNQLHGVLNKAAMGGGGGGGHSRQN